MGRNEQRRPGTITPEEGERDSKERQATAQFITGGELKPAEFLGDQPPAGEQVASEPEKRQQAFKPNVGDDVEYVSPDHGESDSPSLARVVHVNEDGTANLAIWDKYGAASSARNVQLAGAGEKLEGGFARQRGASKPAEKPPENPSGEHAPPPGDTSPA